VKLFLTEDDLAAQTVSLFLCRIIYTAARNDHMPGFLAMVNCKRNTPVSAIIFNVSLLFEVSSIGSCLI